MVDRAKSAGNTGMGDDLVMALARSIGCFRGGQSGEKELRRKNMQNQLFHAFL